MSGGKKFVTVQRNPPPKVALAASEEDDWVVDSGASVHLQGEVSLSDQAKDSVNENGSPLKIATAQGTASTSRETCEYNQKLGMNIRSHVLK